jgi:hypothetical protein
VEIFGLLGLMERFFGDFEEIFWTSEVGGKIFWRF